MDYLLGLAKQENSPITEYSKWKKIYPNRPPEDASKGERDIGFGHKITKRELKWGLIYGIRFEDGITVKEAYDILGADISKHRSLAAGRFGPTFYDLPRVARDVLTDYSFTGTLHSFPSFFQAMKDRDYDEAVHQHERSYTSGGRKVKLVRRNNFIMDMLNELKRDDFFK